ncbi:MAG: hypothetical protein M0P66_10900 [Salinivirgaceae bacterium]|nr:hypothetical protein [Salinivirgaceae bacterium]
MKTSIRNTRFTLGIVLFLAIILILSIVSAFYLNKLSKKTSAILKENHYSIVFARDMSKNLTTINQEVTYCIVTNRNPDTVMINNELKSFTASLLLELNNITEVGEEDLAHSIEKDFYDYRDSLMGFVNLPHSVVTFSYLQMKINALYRELNLLSEMNAKAIEDKTGDAKVYARKTSIQMSFIGALCFLIAYAFTFSFTSYFNDRFFNLYTGIKEVAASNSREKLYIDGADELAEISLIFNQMAEKLHDQMQNIPPSLKETSENEIILQDVNELRKILSQLKVIEIRANQILSSFDSQTEP